MVEYGEARQAGVVRALKVAWWTYFGRRTLRRISSAHTIVGALVREVGICASDLERLEAPIRGVCWHAFVFIRALDHLISRTEVV